MCLCRSGIALFSIAVFWVRWIQWLAIRPSSRVSSAVRIVFELQWICKSKELRMVLRRNCLTIIDKCPKGYRIDIMHVQPIQEIMYDIYFIGPCIKCVPFWRSRLTFLSVILTHSSLLSCLSHYRLSSNLLKRKLHVFKAERIQLSDHCQHLYIISANVCFTSAKLFVACVQYSPTR